MTGKFITFEGGEGCGKTTQAALLVERLRAAGIAVEHTHEPGGTPGAQRIRELLVTGEAERWDAVSELLLFYAARRDHVERRIKPLLAAGTWVVCDRFVDSTMAYQGYAGGLGRPFVEAITRLTLGDFQPDMTIILSLDPAQGLERAAERRGNETRFEGKPLAYHQAVHAAFADIAKREPVRCVVVEAVAAVADVHAAVWEHVRSRGALVNQ